MGRIMMNAADHKCDYPCYPECESRAETTGDVPLGWSVVSKNEEIEEEQPDGSTVTKLVRRVYYYCPEHTS